MTKAGLPILLAGIGIGIAATLLVQDRELQTRWGKALGKQSRRVSAVLSDPEATWRKGEKAVSDIKEKVKDKIDDAADATKKAVDKVAEKSKEAAHKAGEQLERGGKRLQDA